MILKYTVKDRQTLADITLLIYGSIEGIYRLAEENGLSVTDDLTAGRVLIYNPDNVIDKQAVNYYVQNNICPATAFSGTLSGAGIFDNTFADTFE